MKSLLTLILIPAISLIGYGQDSIRYRIIFIGESDAKMMTEPNSLFQHAASNVLQDRTTVFYLDDIDYLQGKTKPGSREERTVKNKLRSQYELMRSRGANLYFIGAHPDWNKIASKEIAAQNRNTKTEADSLLKLSPATICPDPEEIELADNLTAISFNSDWWLFPDDYTVDDSCDCKTKPDVLGRLDELRYKNKDKVILFVSHHPFQSYGVYGNRGTLIDHLFPLTAANKIFLSRCLLQALCTVFSVPVL